MVYSKISSHRSMVFDEHRNNVYARALRKLITPDSVVLDLGAGLGIHGLIAAAAGAKRVYLVDPEPIVQVALEVARANGLADRVVVLEGKIENVELPEQVDIIVSVFTGNLLYTEDLLPSLFFARDKYLKPGGFMVPHVTELVLAPASAPDAHAKFIERWSEPILGMDFSTGRRFAANEMLWLRQLESPPQNLAPGSVISAIDLRDSRQADCAGEARCQIETSGLCHGLLGWIRIGLNDQWLSTNPAGPAVHWSPAFLPVDPPLYLEAGEEICINLQRPTWGDWTWSVKAVSGTRRHSSFLARANGSSHFRKLTPTFIPGINEKGKATLLALTLMQEGKSNQEVAQILFETNAQSFRDFEEALRLVQSMALAYASNG